MGWVPRADVDETGSRIIPAYPDPNRFPACVSLYGDSVTWAAEVDNEHAWSNVLSLLLGCRVANYGGGGYGADQAYLRFKLNSRDKSKVVIIRDYAAALATTGKKWFWGPLCQGKTSQSFCS